MSKSYQKYPLNPTEKKGVQTVFLLYHKFCYRKGVLFYTEPLIWLAVAMAMTQLKNNNSHLDNYYDTSEWNPKDI